MHVGSGVQEKEKPYRLWKPNARRVCGRETERQAQKEKKVRRAEARREAEGTMKEEQETRRWAEGVGGFVEVARIAGSNPGGSTGRGGEGGREQMWGVHGYIVLCTGSL